MITLVLSVVMLVGVLVLFYVIVTELINVWRTRVPFVSTPLSDLKDLATRLPITSADVVYDLGSGNGKVLFAIENLTGARTKGFQQEGWTQMYARLRKYWSGASVELISGNFFNHSWREATVIYAYLFPHLMQRVGEKVQGECAPGTKLVVRDFPVIEMTPVSQWQTPSGHKMFLYIV